MKKTILYLTLFLAGTTTGFSQNISTVAGNGTQGYTGDGGLATVAEVASPTASALDAAGNIYIADQLSNRIRKVTLATGKISTYGGNGVAGFNSDGIQATAAELNSPTGIAVDGSGNVYIADSANNRVRMINGSGVISTIAGTGTPGYTGDGSQATNATLNAPSGLAVDAAGNVYIADFNNNVVRKVNTSGVISTIAGTGAAGYTGDGAAATNATLTNPFAVAVDASGNIYIADYLNSVIRLVTVSSGNITTYAGNGTPAYSGDGAAATAAEINLPMGVALDKFGNLFIGDATNGRVRKVNKVSGNISTFAGTGSFGYNGDGFAATNAKLFSPSGVAFDATGNNLYITDYNEERIREVVIPNGINEITNNSGVNIYPNPANSQLNVSMAGISGNVNLVLYNITGQEVMSQTSASKQMALNVAGIPSGIYLLKVQTEDGNTLVRRVEIAR